jgi:L-asparaginase II
VTKRVPLVLVRRGNITESIHFGHVVVVDRFGKTVAAFGDPGFHTYARSALKPLQALATLESGAAQRYGFTEQELVVVSSSHSGEDMHTSLVRSILAKLGGTGDNLQCGAHPPLNKETAEAMTARGEIPCTLHNNCSGKHAGMIATALALGAPLDTYLDPNHPVQRLILSIVADLCGLPVSEIDIGIDGCGAPVFGMPLHRLALGFARFITGNDISMSRSTYCQTLVKAIADHPYVLAGTNRFDTLLMEVTSGRLTVKSGAEGIIAIGDNMLGLGIVVRVEDGSERALFPAAVEALAQLGLIDLEQRELLDRFHHPNILNWAGTIVGSLQPVFVLREYE